MEKRISVVIPNYNGAATIERCLKAAFLSRYENFEVIVVDDCSEDGSVEIIKRFPCRLICLNKRSGTSKARNAGGLKSEGEIVFFTDSDCLIQPDTLAHVNKAFSVHGPGALIGGTYTLLPHDKKFFSIFQSIFVNYSETRNPGSPDYIAAHAMAVDAEGFKKSGGFPEVFLPIIEDVEFSHRLRRQGYKLVMEPEIQVQHIFDFSLIISICNAYRKTRYWVMYSQKNNDLLADSGSASYELKFNVLSCFLVFLFLALGIIFNKTALLYLVPAVVLINIYVSRKQLQAFFDAQGRIFAGLAFFYYSMVYPFPIGAGTIVGIITSYLRK